jgi:hypothetical protein
MIRGLTHGGSVVVTVVVVFEIPHQPHALAYWLLAVQELAYAGWPLSPRFFMPAAVTVAVTVETIRDVLVVVE